MCEEDERGVRRVTGVQTPLGAVRARLVVNCAGAWAPTIGASCGVRVPLMAMRHAYIVTQRVEGLLSPTDGRVLVPNIRDHDASVYLRVQGDSFAIGGYEANPIFCERGDVSYLSFSISQLLR